MHGDDQLLKLLGFANRARKLTFGMHATVSAIRKKNMRLVLLAADLSENSKRKITNEIGTQTPILTVGSKDFFGRIAGRAELGIVGVVDSSFAKSIRKLVSNSGSSRPT